MIVDDLRFDAQGLIPAVVQEADTGDVLMVAWMDRAAVSATVALFRALVKKGVLTRDEAVRALLDEAVARAIQAEASGDGQATNEINSQSAEILKFIAEKL